MHISPSVAAAAQSAHEPPALPSPEEVKDYRKPLKTATKEETGPRTFINTHRLQSRFEKFFPEMVTSENLRKPGLNGMCFESETEFAEHVAEAVKRGERGTHRCVVIVFDEKKESYHSILYETSFTDKGTFIRGYDPLDEEFAKEHFVPVCKALMEHEIPDLKLVVYALGLQKSATGCQIFALSAALKSLRREQEGGNDFKDFEGRDAFELEADPDGKYVPPYFYKHGHSRTGTKRIAENPLHKKWAQRVNNTLKQSLIKRHDDYRVTQYVMNFKTGKIELKRFSNSIDWKRITFLKRLEKAGKKLSRSSEN
jgi:hypothetical protein